MNFLADNNSFNPGNIPVISASCGDRSSCSNDVNVKREHASTDKTNNSANSSCNS